ncbi:MAG: AraC family transcriptional regulator [Bacteroidales bacterium]
MNIKSIKNIFETHVEELDRWEKRPHKNNFFEIVYIEKGSGRQCINCNQFEYREGNIFLLPPLNCHSFTIDEPTKFYFIRFTDYYFQHTDKLQANYKLWFDNISYILANYNMIVGDIIESESERRYITNSIKSIHNEYLSADSYSEAIISGIVASILNILARNVERRYIDTANNSSDGRFAQVMRHINNNILNSEVLRVPVLAERFGVSKSYFSEYFKRQAGVTLADYVIKAKLRLAETYISHTDQSLKEIAYQLNFSDSSHLANSFKRVYGMTIKEFKESSKN